MNCPGTAVMNSHNQYMGQCELIKRKKKQKSLFNNDKKKKNHIVYIIHILMTATNETL